MPNILIKEYDLTNPGRNEYNSFSVVVPGFVAPEKEEAYDKLTEKSNGIYEVTNQKDFITNVGYIEEGPTGLDQVPAIAANPTELFELDAQEQVIPYEIPIGTEVYKIVATGQTPGNFVDAEGNKYGWQFTSDGEGLIDKKYYTFADEEAEGKDATTEKAYHLGNQLAFELLGLGYTVFYKKIEELTELEDFNEFWAPLKDRAYDFRYVTTGDFDSELAVQNAIKLAKKLNDGDSDGRGDCIALVDLPQENYQGKVLKDALKDMQEQAKLYSTGDRGLGKYTAYFAPHWNIKGNINKRFGNVLTEYTNKRFPAWLYYLACAKQAEANNYDEWFAFAGYSRGTNNLYNIESIEYKFGDSAVEVLQKRDTSDCPSINPIITLKGNYYIWGNRTAYSTSGVDELKASHFLNIRQLCCTLKKQIYMACKELAFEPNSNILWVRFCDKIRPILEKMKANQGIDDYLFVKLVETKKATLKALIRIVPIEAVEDFDISLTLEDSLEGTLVTFGEVEDEQN